MSQKPTNSTSSPGRRERRGFVFIMILIVIFAAAAMVTWSVNRSTTEGLIVEKRLQAYSAHHESLGIRDLVLVWLTREANASTLPDLAKEGGVAYRTVLPDKVVVLVRLRDGQGTIRCTIDPDDPPEVTQRLVEVLQWLPRDRPDLLRRYGAMQVSIAGAEPEVLKALARGNETILTALQRIKERPTVERSNFFQELQRDGIEVEDVQALADMIVFDQNRLWRLDVEVIDPRNIRRYTGLVQTDRNIPQMLEWTQVLGEPEGELDEFTAQEVGRQRR
jgi:hypothetical protein